MLPSSWLTVVSFLLLVAPGLLFDLLAARRRVGVSESAFREVSRIVLASLAFSALGVTSVIACHVFWPTAFPELDKVLVDEAYVRTNPRLLVTAVVTGTAIAMVLAGVTHWSSLVRNLRSCDRCRFGPRRFARPGPVHDH